MPTKWKILAALSLLLVTGALGGFSVHAAVTLDPLSATTTVSGSNISITLSGCTVASDESCETWLYFPGSGWMFDETYLNGTQNLFPGQQNNLEQAEGVYDLVFLNTDFNGESNWNDQCPGQPLTDEAMRGCLVSLSADYAEGVFYVNPDPSPTPEPSVTTTTSTTPTADAIYDIYSISLFFFIWFFVSYVVYKIL